jgi:hypothetical protein
MGFVFALYGTQNTNKSDSTLVLFEHRKLGQIQEDSLAGLCWLVLPMELQRFLWQTQRDSGKITRFYLCVCVYFKSCSYQLYVKRASEQGMESISTEFVTDEVREIAFSSLYECELRKPNGLLEQYSASQVSDESFRYNRARGTTAQVARKPMNLKTAAMEGRRWGSASQHLSNITQISSLIERQCSLLGRRPATTERMTLASLFMCEKGIEPVRICCMSLPQAEREIEYDTRTSMTVIPNA